MIIDPNLIGEKRSELSESEELDFNSDSIELSNSVDSAELSNSSSSNSQESLSGSPPSQSPIKGKFNTPSLIYNRILEIVSAEFSEKQIKKASQQLLDFVKNHYDSKQENVPSGILSVILTKFGQRFEQEIKGKSLELSLLGCLIDTAKIAIQKIEQLKENIANQKKQNEINKKLETQEAQETLLKNLDLPWYRVNNEFNTRIAQIFSSKKAQIKKEETDRILKFLEDYYFSQGMNVPKDVINDIVWQVAQHFLNKKQDFDLPLCLIAAATTTVLADSEQHVLSDITKFLSIEGLDDKIYKLVPPNLPESSEMKKLRQQIGLADQSFLTYQQEYTESEYVWCAKLTYDQIHAFKEYKRVDLELKALEQLLENPESNSQDPQIITNMIAQLEQQLDDLTVATSIDVDQDEGEAFYAIYDRIYQSDWVDALSAEQINLFNLYAKEFAEQEKLAAIIKLQREHLSLINFQINNCTNNSEQRPLQVKQYIISESSEIPIQKPSSISFSFNQKPIFFSPQLSKRAPQDNLDVPMTLAGDLEIPMPTSPILRN